MKVFQATPKQTAEFAKRKDFIFILSDQRLIDVDETTFSKAGKDNTLYLSGDGIYPVAKYNELGDLQIYKFCYVPVEYLKEN